MKRRFVYFATIALMASGMAIAQNNADSQGGNSATTPTQMGGQTNTKGELPAAKEGESPSGRPSTANPAEMRPGTKGTAESPDQGLSPKGTTPATGVNTGQKGTANTNSSLPGAEEPKSGQNSAASQSGGSKAKPAKMHGHTNASGDLPAVKEGEGQSGRPSTANPAEMRPGTKGTAEAPGQGLSPKGTMPATGVNTGQKGTTDTNSSLPGAEEPAPKN